MQTHDGLARLYLLTFDALSPQLHNIGIYRGPTSTPLTCPEPTTTPACLSLDLPGGGRRGVERCEMRGTNMFPVGKFAASEACKSHHRPCAASYRVQSTLDEGPGGRKGSWLAAAKAELGGKESKDIFPKLGTKTVRRISFPPPCRGGGTNRERSVAGGGWWARWVVAPGHVLFSVLSVLSCTVAVDTSNLAIAVSPFLGPRPSRRNLGVRRLDLNSAAPKLARLEEERRRRSRARVLHTMANCRPGGAPSVVGDGAVFEVFFWGRRRSNQSMAVPFWLCAQDGPFGAAISCICHG